MEEEEQIYFSEQKRIHHSELRAIRRAFRQDIYVKNRRQTSALQSNQLQTGSLTEKEPSRKEYKIYDKMREEEIREILEVPIQELTLSNALEELKSKDLLSVHFAIISLRRLLVAFEDEKMIQTIIDDQAIPKLLNLFQRGCYPQLKFQSTWIFNQICQKLVFHKVQTKFIKQLERNEQYLVSNLIATLGNLAAAGSKIRNELVEQGVIFKLTDLTSQDTNPTTLSYITWAMSNILRCKPYLQYKEAIPGLRFMCRALRQNYYNSQPAQAYDIFASFLAFCNSQAYQLYDSENLFNETVEFSNKYCIVPDFQRAIYSAACLLARISNHSKYLKKMVSPSLFIMCENVCKNVTCVGNLKEFLFFISNLVTEERRVTDRLIENQQYFANLVKIFREAEKIIKMEIMHIIGNASLFTSPKIIAGYIQKYEILQEFANGLLDSQDIQFLSCILENLNKIFRMALKPEWKSLVLQQAKQQAREAQKIKENAVIVTFLTLPRIASRLQELQYNGNKQIQKKLSLLLTTLKEDGWGQDEVSINDI